MADMTPHQMKMGFIFLVTCVCFLAPVHQAHLPQNPTITELSIRNMDFAMNLYRKISTYHDNNIFFSPLSISTSFAALSMASAGITHEEMLSVLNLDHLERDDQPQLIPKLFQLLNENITQNGSQKLDQDMSLFMAPQFEVEQAFEDQIKMFFDAEIRSVNFSDSDHSKIFINEFIKERTHGKVVDMLSTLDVATKLMLINTIFFQGAWEIPFNPSHTEKGLFYINNYSIVEVPMMFMEEKFYTMEDYSLGAKVLRLPYKEGVSMLILLPKKGVDYTVIDEEITAERFLSWIKNLQKTKLEVNLPKFKMEQSYSLHKLLPEMGMSSIFESTANLTKISKDASLKVSEVLHKAVIEVDESGTTAAAATSSGITPYSLPRTFTVNRPFFFFIYHEETNCMLFMGRVINPTKN